MPEDPRSVVYTQALATSRSVLTLTVQSATVLLVAYTTIVGFALDRRSWGLLAADLLLILALLAVISRLMGVNKAVLVVARDSEGRSVGDVTDASSPGLSPARLGLADTLIQQTLPAREWWRRYIWLIIVAATIAHIAATVWLAWGEHWSFS